MASQWTVEAQRQEERLTAAGNFEAVMVVTFKVLESNSVHSVEIPLNRYNAEYVKQQIDQMAKQILEVHNL